MKKIDSVNVDIDQFSAGQLAVLKYLLETEFLYHAAFFLAYRDHQPFILAPHHAVFINVLKKVYDGEITRLIVNMPPGSTKTELGVIQFSSFCFVRNPGARFLHISGDKELTLDTSSKLKDQIISDVSKKLWGIEAKDDSKAKGLWKTGAGGGFYARSSYSKLVGYRAGRSIEGFQGALIIDDPQDPSELRSTVKKRHFPQRYMDVIRHRIDNPATPIIVIMQRLAVDDFSGFLLNGGSGEYWHHLCFSALNS